MNEPAGLPSTLRKSHSNQKHTERKRCDYTYKIKKDALLDKHQSRTNALLVLLSGKVVYEEENRKIELLKTYDFLVIPEKVSHSVLGKENSLILLIQYFF